MVTFSQNVSYCIKEKLNPLSYLYLSSANTLNLDKQMSLNFGIELTFYQTITTFNNPI